jgi:hypothetical protein
VRSIRGKQRFPSVGRPLPGFKFSLTKIVIPLVFTGALMRLLGSPRVRSARFTWAEFGLILVGISMLPTAMQA